jgi:acyl carrier protein|tara:strand:+ start:3693 stop:3932 length:240 start_codon:yes stop_codon:yes gene_type:complete
MSEDILKNIIELVADVFGVPVDDIDAKSSKDNIKSWDSINHLNLVLALEETFQKKISPEEIEQMTSVEHIYQLIKEKIS